MAVVLDADYVTEGGLGFGKTLEQFAEKVGNHGCVLVDDVNDNGLIFRHSEALPDIGLWVMPNNNSDGMIEDLLKACVHEDEKILPKRSLRRLSPKNSNLYIKLKQKLHPGWLGRMSQGMGCIKHKGRVYWMNRNHFIIN